MKPTYLFLAALLCLSGTATAQPAPGTSKDEEIIVEDDAGGAVEEGPVEGPRPAAVQKSAPFKDLPGRWVGEGRLGLTEGKTEKVQCRATYFVNPAGNELKQNIRCASASGKIEVKSLVNASKDGKLTGTWNELVYNLGGEMTGEVTERGLRIVVRAGDLTANMDVIVMNDRQIVEIQFFNSALRGLTLILKKG
ncbi:MAG: hypothetical protein WC684_06020 [Hyphomicrobium sp.]|jgi:hypothetical protein